MRGRGGRSRLSHVSTLDSHICGGLLRKLAMTSSNYHNLSSHLAVFLIYFHSLKTQNPILLTFEYALLSIHYEIADYQNKYARLETALQKHDVNLP